MSYRWRFRSLLLCPCLLEGGRGRGRERVCVCVTVGDEGLCCCVPCVFSAINFLCLLMISLQIRLFHYDTPKRLVARTEVSNWFLMLGAQSSARSYQGETHLIRPQVTVWVTVHVTRHFRLQRTGERWSWQNWDGLSNKPRLTVFTQALWHCEQFWMGYMPMCPRTYVSPYLTLTLTWT